MGLNNNDVVHFFHIILNKNNKKTIVGVVVGHIGSMIVPIHFKTLLPILTLANHVPIV
jgi:hypothetical protein